jgi:peroxiredoxin
MEGEVKTIWKWSVGIVAGILLSGPRLQIAASPLEEAEDSLRQRFESALSFFRETSMEFVADSKFVYNVRTQADEPYSRVFMPGETIHRHTVAYKQQGTRFLYDAEHHYWREDGSVIEIAAHNGELVETLNYRPGELRVKRGAKGPHQQDVETVLRWKSDNGTFLRGCLGGHYLLELLRDQDARVTPLPKRESIDGHSCLVLKIENGNSVHKVWIDPIRGFNYLRWECWNKPKEAAEVDVGIWEVTDIELREFDGKWFPVAGKLHHIYSLASGDRDITNKKADWTLSIRLKNIVLGESYSVEDFRIEWPEDTLIYDRRDKRHYEAGADGSLYPYAPDDTMLLTGKRAPELAVAEWVSGESTSLASLQGETVVLAFWDSRDEALAELLSVLSGLLFKYSERGVELVSVHSADADLDALKGFISDKSIRFRVALDKPAKLYKGATFGKYRVRKVPAVFIIDTESKVRYQDIPVTAVEEAVKQLLDE